MNVIHAAQNMTPPQSNIGDSLKAEVARQRKYDEMIHTLRYGPMPDFITHPQSWYFDAGERTKAILKKLGVHPSEAKRMADGIILQAKKEKLFDLYVIFDRAQAEFDQRQRDLEEERARKDMTTKGMKEHYAPPGSVTLAKPKMDEPLPDADAGLNEWFKRETTKDLHQELNQQAANEEKKSVEGAKHPNPYQGFYIGIAVWGYTTDEQKDMIKRTVFGVTHMEQTGLESWEALKIAKEWHFAPADKKADCVWKGKQGMSYASREEYEQSLSDEAEANQLAESHSPDEKAPETKVEKPAETSPSQNVVKDTPPGVIPSANVETPEKPISQNGAEKAVGVPSVFMPVPTSEIVIFDPNRAIARSKASSDLVLRMRTDGVLVAGHDYGTIPGTGKATLLKPGAEKLCTAFNLCPVFDDMDKIEKWDPAAPLFHYRYRCSLVNFVTGETVTTGNGSCNSMESKYRWRDAKRVCPKCGKEIRHSKKQGEGWYCWVNTGGCGATFGENDPTIKGQTVGKVPNDDIFSLVNTIDKMAQKRALIAATLIATNASEYFTQDVESLPDFGYIDAEIVD